ncbi:MAG TPA: hypothetical protein VKY74_21975 [Chloroflexia bacterium]|nr:hypothetical protein [Chloroflexia bacterium]
MAYNGGTYGRDAKADPSDSAPLYCANHPTVPTYLRCGRCDKPICARCRVATPVGHRCFTCANVTVLPTYAVSRNYYTRAVLAGLGLATGVGLLWALLPGFQFWAALILGLGAGEVVSAAANQKRGPGLQAVGIVSVIWGVVLSRLALAYLLTSLPVASFISNIPGNPDLTGVSESRTLGSILQALVQPPNTDLVSLIFILLALGLTIVRLR